MAVSPSASAAASTGIQANGAPIYQNQPNYTGWVVAGIGLVLGAVVLVILFRKR